MDYVLVPKEPTDAIRKALRTGSRKDYPSDELCDVRWCAAIATAPKVEQIPQQWKDAVKMAIEVTQKVINMPRSAESIRLCTLANTTLRELVKP